MKLFSRSRAGRSGRTSGPINPFVRPENRPTDRPAPRRSVSVFAARRPSVSHFSLGHHVVHRRVRPGRRRRPRRHHRSRRWIRRHGEDLRLPDADGDGQPQTPQARVRRRDGGVGARARPPCRNRRSSSSEEVCRRSARAAACFARTSQAGPTVMRLATARAANCDETKLRSEEESGRSGRSGQTAGRTNYFQTKKIDLLYLRNT